MPSVSVFIPTYNSSLYIGKTIDSLLSQTYKDIEVLLVDDESSDNTVDILNSYAERDSRVKVLLKENEGSVPFSWNYVFPYLSGEFTIYMSHDDLLEPTTIEKLIKKQQSESDIDCVIPSLVFFEKDMHQPEACYQKKNQYSVLSEHLTITGHQAFDEMLDYSIPGFALWRTELIRQIGMPTDSFNSDECMQRVWAKNCRKVAFSDAKFGYRQSSQSIVKGMKTYHLFSLATNLRLYKEMITMNRISKDRKNKLQYKWFETLFYLDSQYRRMKNLMEFQQQNKFEAIRKESYSLLREGLEYPRTHKGFAMKLSATNRFIYSFLLKTSVVFHNYR